MLFLLFFTFRLFNLLYTDCTKILKILKIRFITVFVSYYLRDGSAKACENLIIIKRVFN